MDNEKRCNVFILWKIVEIFKYYFSGVDERIMALKIRLADLR